MVLEMPLGLSRGVASDGFSAVCSCMTSSFNSSLVLRNLYIIAYLEIRSYKFCIRATVSSQICVLPSELTCLHFPLWHIFSTTLNVMQFNYIMTTKKYWSTWNYLLRICFSLPSSPSCPLLPPFCLWLVDHSLLSEANLFLCLLLHS